MTDQCDRMPGSGAHLLTPDAPHLPLAESDNPNSGQFIMEGTYESEPSFGVTSLCVSVVGGSSATGGCPSRLGNSGRNGREIRLARLREAGKGVHNSPYRPQQTQKRPARNAHINDKHAGGKLSAFIHGLLLQRGFETIYDPFGESSRFLD